MFGHYLGSVCITVIFPSQGSHCALFELASATLTRFVTGNDSCSNDTARRPHGGGPGGENTADELLTEVPPPNRFSVRLRCLGPRHSCFAQRCNSRRRSASTCHASRSTVDRLRGSSGKRFDRYVEKSA